MIKPISIRLRIRFDEYLHSRERRCQRQEETRDWRQQFGIERQLLADCFDLGKGKHTHLAIF